MCLAASVGVPRAVCASLFLGGLLGGPGETLALAMGSRGHLEPGREGLGHLNSEEGEPERGGVSVVCAVVTVSASSEIAVLWGRDGQVLEWEMLKWL